jgi:hypothetical protein
MSAPEDVCLNSQLEHVKLFLAEQKPLAVSRWQPSRYVVGQSEFPLFIYGHSDDFKERPLVMRSIDVSAALILAEDMRDVAVENIELVRNTDEGVIRVCNIAFEKCIAARFTLEKWQTTSEVTARYKESLPKWHHRPLYFHNQTGRRCFPRGGEEPPSRCPIFGFRLRNMGY